MALGDGDLFEDLEEHEQAFLLANVDVVRKLMHGLEANGFPYKRAVVIAPRLMGLMLSTAVYASQEITPDYEAVINDIAKRAIAQIRGVIQRQELSKMEGTTVQ